MRSNKVKIMEYLNEFPGKVSITTHQTRFSDGDPAGIVYFSNYPMFFDEAFIAIAKSFGFDWGQRDMEFLIPIVEQKVSHKRPLTVGQEFQVATAIIYMGSKSFRTGHMIFYKKDGKITPVAHGYIVRAAVDPNTFSSMPLPENLENALVQHYINQDDWNDIIEKYIS